MKIAVVTPFPPSKDNRNQPNALLWHMIRNSPKDYHFDLYSTGGESRFHSQIVNDLEELILHGCYTVPPKSRVSQYMGERYQRIKCRLRGLPWGVSYFSPNSEIIRRINSSKPDVVWLFPLWMIDWIGKIRCKNIVVSATDSVSLHVERTIRYGDEWDCASKLQPMLQLLEENQNLERLWANHPYVKLHFVGVEDMKRFRMVSGQEGAGFFIRHPVYNYQPKGDILTSEKVKVLFSTGYRKAYNADHPRRLINALAENGSSLREKVEFRFLGSGYSEYVRILSNAGFTTSEQGWVENYDGELTKHDVQVFPIAIGTGTKGKVLQSMATGLLGIGSELAFENIAVIPGRDCLEYQRPEDVVEMLHDIANEPNRYRQMARSGAEKVRSAHSVKETTSAFWRNVDPRYIDSRMDCNT